MTAQRGKHKNI